jgi:hypothetical protein
MANKKPALVTVSSAWISKNGLGKLFDGEFASINGDPLIQATDYSLEDHSFVELEFYPSSFDKNWVKVFIPRNEIVSIIVLQKRKDASLIGFKGGK